MHLHTKRHSYIYSCAQSTPSTNLGPQGGASRTEVHPWVWLFPTDCGGDQVHHDPDAKQAAHVVELQQQLASAQAVSDSFLSRSLPPFRRPAHSPPSPIPHP